MVQTESCSQTSPHSSFLDVYIKHGLACIIIEERNIKLISQTLFTFKTQASDIKKKMEWKKCYLDVILVPLGFLISIGYHFWLWYTVRTHPHTTIIGINASGRRNWVAAMMKVYILILFYIWNLASKVRF